MIFAANLGAWLLLDVILFKVIIRDKIVINETMVQLDTNRNDLVDGITKMMSSPDKLLGPINLGNPNEFTILELAENILRLTKSKSKLIHMPLPSDDPTQRKPDISKANDDLLWEPKVQLEDGLKETINYFSTKLGI